MLKIYVLEYKNGRVFISIYPDFGILTMNGIKSKGSCLTERTLHPSGGYEIQNFYINGAWVSYDEAIDSDSEISKKYKS